jgi:hypothetical protein
MIISSFNVRGLGGGVVKWNAIKELVRQENIEFLAIQETKIEAISDSFCYNIWGGEDCQWIYLPAVGKSGGMLSFWSKSSASLIFSFSGESFIGVCLDWGALNKRVFIVNVYSKCDINGKRALWDNLIMSKLGFGNGPWCILGDFNAVLNVGERKGVNHVGAGSPSAEIVEFSNYVSDMELVDLPTLGRRFTWFHSNGISMSRIDRVLVSEDWLGLWEIPSLWVLPRTVSDHCPLVVRYNCVDWGPRPFRFNNHWLIHKEFRQLVEVYWMRCDTTGWMAYILKEKLRGLKEHIKVWNKATYGQVDSKIAKLIGDINELDVRSEGAGLIASDVELRKTLFAQMWHLKISKASVLAQRSRSRWLKEGDENSCFFYVCINSRGKKNFIRALRVGNDWLETPSLIRRATVDYFANHFSAESWNRPKLDGIVFPILSDDENMRLVSPFSLEEIEKVVMECDGNKSPGPYRFNFAFVKAMWSLIKGEIRIMFDQFHGIGTLPKSFTSYFVALIPKVNSSFELGDFRPISLLGCLYKIIAKVLTARLARVMDRLVASTQLAFLKGRQLVDGVVVVNEVVDLVKRTSRSCIIFKVDFEKAYDSVDWSFLDYMLVRFGFCSKWRDWIRACVF